MSSFVLAFVFFRAAFGVAAPSIGFLYPFAEKGMHANLLDEFQQILHERVATDGIAGGMEALPEKVVETVSPPPEVVKPRAGRGNLSGILVL